MQLSCEKDNDYNSVDEDSASNTLKKLTLVCGTSDVGKITHLQLRPYPSGCFMCRGSKLTNLTSLCLSGSAFLDLRDIGTSLKGLNELFVSHCNLESLDGIANFPDLTAVFASFNNISDLSACVYLEKMCHIDVERNAIQDTKCLEPLSLCSKLESAVFRGNPFSLRNYGGSLTMIEDYEEIVRSIIPQLKYVDSLYPSSDSPENLLISKDDKLVPLQHILGSPVGSNTSFLSDRSETLSTSGKIYCGSPGRAFKSGFSSSSDVSARNTTPVDEISEVNVQHME